jgi:hypothetical protein
MDYIGFRCAVCGPALPWFISISDRRLSWKSRRITCAHIFKLQNFVVRFRKTIMNNIIIIA